MSNKNSFQVLLLLPPPSSSNANRFAIEPKGFTMEPQIELSDFFFFFFPDGSQLVHPLAGLNCLRYRGVFLIFLKVFFTAASRSGSGPSSANGNSLHGTFSGTIAGCFLGILMGSVGGGVTGSLFGALLGVVTSSLLGVTWLKILLSNFCFTAVTKSPSSSFRDLANVVGSA